MFLYSWGNWWLFFFMCVKMSVYSCHKLINKKIINHNKKLKNFVSYLVFLNLMWRTLLNKSDIELFDFEQNLLKFSPKHSIKNKFDNCRLQSCIESMFGFYFHRLSNLSNKIDFNSLKHALRLYRLSIVVTLQELLVDTHYSLDGIYM